MNDTIATQRTGTGRAAVATVSVRGSRAVELVMSRFQPAGRDVKSLRRDRIYFGTWTWQTYVEELVVCRVDDDEVQIHCHGGRVAAAAILDSLDHAGARIVSSGEWLQQFEPDRFVREALELLPRLNTAKTVAIALDQARHAMRIALETVGQHLACRDAGAAMKSLQQTLGYGSLGTRLGTPFRVVLLGPPNSGKSSLINALVGFDRAIVHHQPGTTRDVVTTETAVDGWPVTLSDTAGLRTTNDPVEQAGIELATQSLHTADLVLLIEDLSAEPAKLAGEATSTNFAAAGDIRSLRVGTKCDLEEHSHDVDVRTSSLKRTGIKLLCRRLIEELVPHPPTAGAAVPLSSWQVGQLRSLVRLLEQQSLEAASKALSVLASDP